MAYYGRYQHPDGRWMRWIRFYGKDDAKTHCNRMARGQRVELLSEQEYNLEFNQGPDPKEPDIADAFERLTGGLEEPEDLEDFEEDDPYEVEEERGVGRPRIKRPSKEILQRLYVDQGKSIRAIAAELGLSRDMIHNSLKEHGIETRSSFRESRLAKYPLELIKEKVRALGYERAAREFSVGTSSLWFYLKTH